MNVLANSFRKLTFHNIFFYKTNSYYFSKKTNKRENLTKRLLILKKFQQTKTQKKLLPKSLKRNTDFNLNRKISIDKDYSHVLFNKSFQNLISVNYNINSIFITTSVVFKYNIELNSNPNYSNYFKDWNFKTIQQKKKIIEQESLNLGNVTYNDYFFYKPYIDLFIYFIIQNYQKEILSLRFLCSISDLSKPHLWYPLARKHKRVIIFHSGPTNSGKTSEALTKLADANTGIYCAPLRLLAWEIQEKLVKLDVKCSLLTGQERIMLDNCTHYSCTIEMCPTHMKFNVAIIDEIQLIGDNFRGSAWTTALLGLQADEIHICGDERSLKLVYDICEQTGDTLIKKTYTRLGDLIVEKDRVQSVSQLKPGDCIISFSRKEIFKLKEQINLHFRIRDKEINTVFMNRCSIIYGNLPPEIKKVQATAFNENKNGVSFLVATDAVLKYITLGRNGFKP